MLASDPNAAADKGDGSFESRNVASQYAASNFLALARAPFMGIRLNTG